MKRFLSIVLAFVLCTSLSLTVYAADDKGVLPSGVSYSNIETIIDAYVEAYKDTTAAVSVAVFTGNNVLMEKAYGYSDIENKIANDKDTVFEWGSCSKLLVWISIMQLVEKGKIELNKDIRAYLPEDFLKKIKFHTPITILNLMNHNAGWQETVTELFVEDKNDIKELREALQLIEPDQIYEPGTVVAYSNWGSALAAYIVERVSGQSFDDYVHEHIFQPLDMNHTALNATLSDNEWVAEKRKKQKCYTTKNESLGTCQYYLSLYPAGMATGTISDFVKFGQALLVSKVEKSPLFEKRKTLDEILSPSLIFVDGVTPRNYHGFWTDELGVDVLWHNGGTIGSSSWFAFDQQSSTGMIILTNQAGEFVYNCGLLPKVFGKYEGDRGIVAAEDISGIYVSSRTCFKGFAKPYNLVSIMRVVSKGDGVYSVPGTHRTISAIGQGSYLLDEGGLKQFVIYASVGEEGHTVLQLPASDFMKVNGYGLIAKYGLLVLFILAAFYGFSALIISLIGFIKGKRPFGIIEKYCAIVNASVTTTAIMFIYMWIKLFSGFALFEEVLWSIILNGILALVPVACSAILLKKWKKLNCTKKEKVKLIITCISGFIMTVNVIYWEVYKFW